MRECCRNGTAGTAKTCSACDCDRDVCRNLGYLVKNIKVIMTVLVACNLLVLRAVIFIQKSPKDANDGRLRERTSLNNIESVLQRPDW